MNLSNYVPDFLTGDDADKPTIEMLEDLFRERESTLDLSAQFELPEPNMTDEPTAVFPYTIYDSGEVYGSGSKEFPIPDDGFADNDANVTRFIAAVTDTAPADVAVGSLYAVEGSTVSAELTDDGNIEPNLPLTDTIVEGDN